jgi:hypothetical protein
MNSLSRYRFHRHMVIITSMAQHGLRPADTWHIAAKKNALNACDSDELEFLVAMSHKKRLPFPLFSLKVFSYLVSRLG